MTIENGQIYNGQIYHWVGDGQDWQQYIQIVEIVGADVSIRYTVTYDSW